MGIFVRRFLGALVFFGFAAQAKEVTLIIYVDQSQSMGYEAKVLSKMADVITQRLEKTCGKYRVAVSGISYVGSEARTPSIKGTPKFITERHGQIGVNLLRERILSMATSEFSSKEKTYTTIVESFKREQSELYGSDFVATLLLTDAVPAFEEYTAAEALEEIYKIIPKRNFMSFGIVPSFHLNQLSCSVDESPILVSSLSNKQLDQPYLFFRQSGGFVADVCSKDMNSQIDEFLSLVISNAECQQLM